MGRERKNSTQGLDHVGVSNAGCGIIACVSLLTLVHRNGETLGMLLAAPCFRFFTCTMRMRVPIHIGFLGCQNKGPQTGWLKAADMCSLTLLKAEV